MTRAHQVGGVDAGGQVVEGRPGVQGHDDFFKRGVAGPFADAVDGAFRLAGAGLQSRQGVGGGESQIVVAMHRDDAVLDPRDVREHARDQFAELSRLGIAHRVGHVERGRPGGYGCGEHLVEKIRIGAAGVLGAEFDVGAALASIGDHLEGLGENLLAGHAQLVLEVNVRGRDEGMNARMGCGRNRVPRGVDVARIGPAQTRNHRAVFSTHLAGHPLDRLEVAGRSRWKTRFDDIHAQTGELMGDFDLGFGVEGGSGRLLAVAQGGVEDAYVLVVRHGEVLCQAGVQPPGSRAGRAAS
jgi:hypothetical protein